MSKKLADRDRQAQRRRRRLENMTAEEREAYGRWLASHRPGSAAERANERWARAAFAKWRAEEESAVRTAAAPEVDLFA